MGARLLLDLLYKSELVDRDSLLVALLLAELPTEEEIKNHHRTYSYSYYSANYIGFATKGQKLPTPT